MPYFFSPGPASGIAVQEPLSVVLVPGLTRSARVCAEQIQASAGLAQAVL